MRHQPPQFQPKKLHPHGRRMTQGNTVPGSLATRKKIRSSGRTRSKLLLGLLWMPEILLNDYPPDIRKKHGPMSERSKRHRVSVAIVIGAVALSLASPAARRRSRSACITALRHVICVLQAKFRRGSFGDSISQAARLTFFEKHYRVRKSILPNFGTV